MIALVVRSLGRVRILSASLAIVLAALQLSIIAGAASFVDSGNFERLAQVAPAFVAQTMGPALTSFRGMVLFAYFDPLIVMLLVQFAIYLATEPAGEVESNLVDLVLARPLPRHAIVSRTVVVMVIGTVLMVGAMQATTWVGLWWMAPRDVQWPDGRTVVSLSAHMTLIACCFGCVALAASGWARRRGAVVGASASSRSPPTWSSSSSRSGRRRESLPASRPFITTRRPASSRARHRSFAISPCSESPRWPRWRSPTGGINGETCDK